ncbi:MAG: SH3 domain-containing protein, partial [Clostridia bacterium]|nr:SH3 domain-containing protein [Clostridia bacterium]
HLRAAPNTDAASLGLYFTGAQATILSAAGDGWQKVSIGAETGYMLQEYLVPVMPVGDAVYCLVDNPHSTWVNLRSEPSMKADILKSVDIGRCVELLGETAAGWSYVIYEGRTGYMVTDYLTRQTKVATEILGTTPDGDYIHRCIPGDGAPPVYFTAIEKNPHIRREDVNFDGYDDLVIHTALGASNFFAEFFVYDEEQRAYVRAEHAGIDTGICNYTLFPEQGLVYANVNNGYAGALHENYLFRWEGNNLRLIRRAVSAEWTEYSYAGPEWTMVTHGDVLQITVTDYPEQQEGGTVLWEHMISLEDTEYRDIFTEENEALWQGLR